MRQILRLQVGDAGSPRGFRYHERSEDAELDSRPLAALLEEMAGNRVRAAQQIRSESYRDPPRLAFDEIVGRLAVEHRAAVEHEQTVGTMKEQRQTGLRQVGRR